jgi:hypothetical protein
MLDVGGEYFIDRANARLYFIPPEGVGSTHLSSAFISVANSSCVVKDVSKVTFRGILFGFTKGTAVSLQNVSDFHVENCTIGNSGSNGLQLQGSNSSVRNSHVFGTGCTAIRIEGGDQLRITPGNILVQGNVVHDFGRLSRAGRIAAALLWYGCGAHLD